MKNIKNIFILLSLSVIFVACGQTKNKKMERSFQKIEKLYQEVIHYNNELEYYVEGYQSGCYYKIYVNDLLVFKHYKNIGLVNHAVSINSKILKSGPQQVTIKLYPLGEIDGKNYTTINPDDSFRLKIFARDKQKTYKAFDYDFLQEYHADIKTSVPYFEETITFNAKVPYELEGWSNSQNLKEMDQDILKKEVLAFYRDFSNIISNKNISKWQNQIYKREKEIAQSRYLTKDETKEIANEFNLTFESDSIEFLPIDNYDIVFYAEGKVIKLESKKFRKKSALISIENRIYEGQIRKAYIFHGLSLHMPKDSNKLEIIR